MKLSDCLKLDKHKAAFTENERLAIQAAAKQLQKTDGMTARAAEMVAVENLLQESVLDIDRFEAMIAEVEPAPEEVEEAVEEPESEIEEPEVEAPAGDIEAEMENLSDEEVDEMLADVEAGPKEKPKPKKPKKKGTAKKRVKKPKEQKKLSDIVAEGAGHGLKGAEEALTGLYELFGGKALKSFPGGIDEDTYAKAKPHFEAAYEHMKASGKSLKEFFQFLVDQFGAGIKPYLRRFRDETKASIKAAKEALGEFKNVGYVYDPEEIAKGTAGKTPKSAAKVIADKMSPANIWGIKHPEGTSPGTVRLMAATKKMFWTFKEWVDSEARLGQYSSRRTKKFETRIENWLDAGHTIDELKDFAQQYGEALAPVVNAFSNKTTIIDSITDLQQVMIPNVQKVGGAYPTSDEMDRESYKVMLADIGNFTDYTRSMRIPLYRFVSDGWSHYLADENNILLSEIDIHKRTRNAETIRTGLPDYLGDKTLTKSEDLQDPFGFSGVGYGTSGWINQDERRRVVHAAFNSFKDLAATIGAPDKGMGLNGELAVQFANLGHKAKGAAAAYFPTIKTINFTRDAGDGTLSHEWGHGFHYLASQDVKDQLENLISDFFHKYDFEAGVRMADDLMARDSSFMKRVVDVKKQPRIDYVKDEVRKRYEDAVKKETDYYKTAKKMDADYTARRTEMWARALEAYVYDNLGGQNNYLVNDFVEAGRIGGKSSVGDSLVYPAGKERETFNESVAHFLDGVQWDKNGLPTMKDDYVELENMNEERMEAELQELLDQIEERYEAIWASEPSEDGLFWYRYDATSLAPMMQPDDYAAYDKVYQEDGQVGTGAVAYLTQLHPDDILGFKLTNIKYGGENATYISTTGGIDDSIREDGEEPLDEESTGPDGRPKTGGDLQQGDQEGVPDGEGGTFRPGGERGSDRGVEGDSDEGAHPARAGNFRIVDDSLNDPKSVNERFNSNLAAIKVLRNIEADDRSATLDEKIILSQYSGFGGMAELFAYDPSPKWKAHHDLLAAELNQKEMDAAARSAPSAYYTPVPVARFMWKLAQRLGFTGGPVLDPAFGANGVFTGTIPEELDGSVTVHGVEKDGLSSRIASKLYEKTAIENLPFEDSKKPMNRFNLTITNVPFANYAPADPKHNKLGLKIHNYYINKMLDLTARGGLAMAVTTSNTMDNTGAHLTDYAKKADLVGVIRLPSDIYNATDVVTDIVVFRKKIEGSEYTGVDPKEWNEGATPANTSLTVNKYFESFPEMVAGTVEEIAGRWGKQKLRIVAEPVDLMKSLGDRAVAFPENIVELEVKVFEPTLDDIIPAPGTIKEGGIYINEKKQVSEKVDGQEVVWPTKTPKDKRNAKVGRGFIKILDGVRTVLRSQKQGLDDTIVKADQRKLKKAYNDFVKEFGAVNDPKNQAIYNFITDAPWVMSLEEYDIDEKKVVKLADIFTKKIVGTEPRPTFAESDHDALSMSLDEFGYPNLEYMAKLRNSDVDTIMKGVEDKIVENPETGILETVDEYLSGNVRRKLQVAEEMAKDNPEYNRNVELLESALPPDIAPHRITARIGAPWIKPEHLSDFMSEKLNMGGDLTPVFSFNPATYLWSMSFKGRDQGWKGEVKAETKRAIMRYKDSVESKSVWGTPRMDFFTLMDHAISGRQPVVTYWGADNKKHTDEVATAGAEAKLQEIQREFNRWLFAEGWRADDAAQRFNERENTSTKSNYDGSHLTFPGKSHAVLTAKEAKQLGVDERMVFYDHQVNAVWQYLRNGNIYLAHEVGAGKTMTMALIAMEAKRLKGKKKVVYVTLNDSTMGQAVDEIKRLYPLANVMPIQVSTIKQRQRQQLQKMAMNDFDVAIMRQQDLDRIALSPESERVFIDQELVELREVLEEAKAQGSRILEQDIQVRIDALEAKLKEPGAFEQAKEEQRIFFDDLGVDLLIVDEAHEYKNIPYSTTLDRVTGLNPTGSKTAHSFFRKTQYLNAQYPKNDALVLASGTPLTNSIGEFYNLQRVLNPVEMKKKGLWRFDRWIANYGDIGSQLEWDGARQTHKLVTTNKRIVNAGRLLASAFQNIDSVRADDTKIVRPKIHGGKPTGVSIDPNEYLQSYYENVVKDRLREIEMDPKNAEFEGIPDNILRIISNMSALAIDQRLLGSKQWSSSKKDFVPGPGPYADTELQEDSKIYQASEVIYRRWKEEKARKGVQLVFADIGVPNRYTKKFKYKTDDQVAKLSTAQLKKYNDDMFEHENATQGFNTYDGIKDRLIELGMPADQIAFIHDADHSNKVKKAGNLRKLFKKVNDGKVRVLIGSTKKAGTGVNVQKRVSDIHHIDVWWNFSAWEQRNGRGLRAGNMYTDTGVRIWNYITEKSVDAHRWGKIFQKGKVLHTALTGDINIDVIEDISEEVVSAKEMEAIGSGNPLLAKQAELIQKTHTLGLEQSSYLNTVRDAKFKLAQMPSQISVLEDRIDRSQKSIELMEPITAVRFMGSEDTLILKKDGKKIAAALAEPVEATRPKDVKDDWWKKGGESPLLVFGTHTETETTETVDGKEKKVKKVEFHPLPVEAFISANKEDHYRQISIRNGITSNQYTLASFKGKMATKKKKGQPADITGNVSRSLSSFVSGLKSAIETANENIEDLNSKKKPLENVVSAAWPKQAEFEEAQKELQEVERQMAAGEAGPDASAGVDISNYKGPVPMLDDFADKHNWKDYGGFVYAKSSDWDFNIGFDRREYDIGKYFADTRKKLKTVDAYYPPRAIEHLRNTETLDKIVDPPRAMTTINGVTEFWVSSGNNYFSIDPESWRMVDRVVGAGGDWRLKSEGTYADDNHYLIHHGIEGNKDAIIKIEKESDVPEGVKEPELYLTHGRESGPVMRELRLSDIKKAFPGQKVTETPDRKYAQVKMKGGQTLLVGMIADIRPSAATVKAGYSEEAAKGGVVRGAYGKGKIMLVKDRADRWTLDHETEHWMENTGLITSDEIGVIRKHIIKLHKQGKWDAAKKDDIGGREDRAEFVAMYLHDRRTPQPMSVTRIIRKIAEFVDKFINLFDRTLGGILRDIETGQVLEREGWDPSFGRTMYQITPAEDQAVEARPFNDGDKVRNTAGIDQVYDEEEDKWFSEKDYAIHQNAIEARLLQKELLAAVGSKRASKRARDLDAAIHIYLDTKRNPHHLAEYYDSLTEEQKRIVDLSQTIEDNPRLLALADKISEEYEKLGQRAMDFNVISNVLDNYVARVWKFDDKKSSQQFDKFVTKSRHARHRVFETILEGMSTGLELKVQGAVNNLQAVKDEIARVIEDKKLHESLQKAEFQDTGEKIFTDKTGLKGYKRLNNFNFSTWKPWGSVKGGTTSDTFINDQGKEIRLGKNARVEKKFAVVNPATGRAYRILPSEADAVAWRVMNIRGAEQAGDYERAQKLREASIDERVTLWERRQLYAPDKIAERLNKITGYSVLKGKWKIGETSLIDELTKWNQIAKSTILMTGLFHHQAFLRSYLFGTRKKTAGEWNPKKAWQDGMQAMEEMSPEIELGIRNGLTLGVMQDLAEESMDNSETIIGRVLNKNKFSKSVKDKLLELKDRQAQFLFGSLGAGLKSKAFLIELRNAIAEHPDMEENARAKMVAGLINADFGGLHLGRMGRDPTVQHLFRLFALAPDWTESNILSMARAMKAGGKAETAMYRKFWASVLTKSLGFTVAGNLLVALSSGNDDDDFIEHYKKAWKAGNLRWLDLNITPAYRALGGKDDVKKFFSIIGHFRDPLKFMVHPIRSAHHKGSVIYGLFHEAMGGTDWKGHRFTTLPELLGVDDKGVYLTTAKGKYYMGEAKGGKFRFQTVTDRPGRSGPIEFEQFPSYLLSQARGVTPIQVQNLMAWAAGEANWFDALTKGAGFYTSTTYPRDEQTKLEREFKKRKGQLVKVRGQYEQAEDKRKFQAENREELMKYSRLRAIEGRLKSMKKVITKLSALPETARRQKRIEQFINRRDELIENYLKGE